MYRPWLTSDGDHRMGDFDPVEWDTIEAVHGPPAAEVVEYVDRMAPELRDVDPYTAVKTIHDAISADLGADRTVPDQGEVFLTAYLLERDGIVVPDSGGEMPSVVARRPEDDRLRELFWDRHRTMWWIAVMLGVHWSLVRYWLYEADIPLRERNFTEASLTDLRAYRRGNQE